MEIVYQAAYSDYILNLSSILLGLAAIVFAIHSLQVKGCLICCTASLGMCGISILCQLFELKRLARIGDWAAVEDTLGARCFAGAGLLAVLLILHIAALVRGRNQKCDHC